MFLLFIYILLVKWAIIFYREGHLLFKWDKEGPRIFLRMQRGGPEKIGNWRSQTDGPPLPVKNDSSLN